MSKSKKVAVKKVYSVNVKKDKKETWAGSQALMGHVIPGSKEAKERQLIKMTSAVLNVSPFGVNILGSLPYINKLGLGQKSLQYGKGKDVFVYNWVQRALNDTDKAICECKVVRDGKDITDWVTGECSPVTIKMGTLKGYQNHMAQTRAKNRAILEAYAVQIHEEMIENIGNAIKSKDITEKQAEALIAHSGKATSTSIEEVTEEKSTGKDTISNDIFHYEPVKDAVVDDVIHVCAKCDCPVTEQEAAYSKRMFGGKILCREHQAKAKAVLAAKKKK